MKYDIYFIGCSVPVCVDLAFTLDDIKEFMSSNAVYAFKGKIIHWRHIAIVEAHKTEDKK